MQLSDFCRDLKLDGSVREKWEPVWEDLTAEFAGVPFYMTMGYFQEYYPKCHGIDTPEFRACAGKTCRIAAENPAAALLAHVMYRGLFVLKTPFAFNALPDELPFYGKECSGMLKLLICMGLYPQLRKIHDEIGIPEPYATNALKWLGGTTYQYAAGHDGGAGTNTDGRWFRQHVDRTLFRIGRLEYRLNPYTDALPAIYRDRSGKIAVLCRDRWHYLKNGKKVNDGDAYDFSTSLTLSPAEISGTPIDPDGSIDFTRKVTLKLADWQAISTPWECVPSIHIPGGEPVTFEAVKSSLIEAREFFRHYLKVEPPLFSCVSWILNPAWENYLPGGNMTRFRREGYAFVVDSREKYPGMRFLFGRDDVSPLELPAVNTAQRAFQQAYRDGELAVGGVFFLTSDLEKLGCEYYRTCAQALK